MKPIEKAVWYIESHYGESVTLDDLAGVAGISRYQLSRMFVYVTGISISGYLRDRRLSQAAFALAAGKNDILDLALSLGYSSHEAFSRAFKRRFGQTPEAVREQGHTENLKLLEAMRMNTMAVKELQEPRIEQSPALLLVGLSRTYANGDNSVIPGQWQEFGPRIGNVADQVGNTAFGVVYNMDDADNFEYLSAVEVSGFDRVADDLTRLRLPVQSYAVFQHQGHVSEVQATCAAIWGSWLPGSGREPADSPFFERYGESFDPVTGNGGLEVWLPLK